MLNKICLAVLAVVLIAGVCAKKQMSVQDTILSNFMEKGTKELYKVWHTVYNKQYDYNTVEGINRYKAFKANVQQIKAHNSQKSCWKQGLNEFSDLTESEFMNHFNLNKNLSINEMRKLISLDEYDDSDDHPWTRDHPNVKHPNVLKADFDHRKNLLPVRHQGSCGSCWAFATMTMVEGNWNGKNTRLSDYLSTQQLVDCDKKNNGCNGGWYTAALQYIADNGAAYEKGYPYKAKEGSCKSYSCTVKRSPVKFTSFDRYEGRENAGDKVHAIASKGPTAVAIYANGDWMNYKSGILTARCASSSVNHAVVVVGYGHDGNNDDDDDDDHSDCVSSQGAGGYWIIQNSWGTSWGDKGFIRLKDDPENMGSCHVANYGYRPRI